MNNTLNSFFIKCYYLLILTLVPTNLYSSEGFYKDIFVDAGVALPRNGGSSAADYLGLTREYLASNDQTVQNQIMVTRSIDENGCLLYPDNEPRFRVVFVCGGHSVNHGNSLGALGRSRFQSFYNNGGAGTGSCAGHYIWHLGIHTNRDSFFHLVPAYAIWGGGADYHSYEIDTDTEFYNNYCTNYSTLVDGRVENVRHNDGGATPMGIAGIEYLARHTETSISSINNQYGIISYKKDSISGRIVICGSHPEDAGSGERMHISAAMMEYALAGQGDIESKATLQDDVIRYMNDNSNPGYEKLGDKQYHHFDVVVPSGTGELRIILDGDLNNQGSYDFHLFEKHGSFALSDRNPDYSQTTSGEDKTLTIPSPTAGIWYIGVKLATTIDAIRYDWGFDYQGKTEVLNGIAYSIKVKFDAADACENDADGDNYGIGPSCAGPDCDDTDPEVHPGATETCNGVDDDCDGTVPEDEDDADADGYRVCQGDCLDDDADANPGKDEVGALCTDGIDNDCDGYTDEADPPCSVECTSNEHCSDGNVCNGTETCDENRTCQTGTALDCDDGNSCTNDACDPIAGCEPVYNSLPCDDGDVCSMEDTCQAGACSGEPLDADGDGYVADSCGGNDCDDSDAQVHPGIYESDAACNDGSDNDCDGLVDDADPGCMSCSEDTDCRDGNVCNGEERCSSGACEPGAPLECDDQNSCTEDRCLPESGCTNAPNTSPCDDGDECTTQDACDSGECQGVLVDVDGDGHAPSPCGGDDCDDGSADIHPGVAEACDGVDNDCNGETDEGCVDPVIIGGCGCGRKFDSSETILETTFLLLLVFLLRLKAVSRRDALKG